MTPPRVTPAYIQQRARRYGLDPRAVLAVAAQEGLSGGIGDNGTSFGPFQLHYGGAYPASAPQGADASQAWAWSPQGVDYALSRMGQVAGGQTGGQAVRSIVSRFERPADPGPEITRALAAYGAESSSGRTPGSEPGGGGSIPSPAVSPSTGRREFAQALLAARTPTGLNTSGLLQALINRRNTAASAPTQGPAAAPGTATPTRGGGTYQLAELLHEGVGGPTNSTGEHIHAAFKDPQSTLRAIRLAQTLGLSVRENPYTDPVDPVHAPNSYHKLTFPGLYGGRKLGEAIDVSGPRMLDFYRRLGGR